MMVVIGSAFGVPKLALRGHASHPIYIFPYDPDVGFEAVEQVSGDQVRNQLVIEVSYEYSFDHLKSDFRLQRTVARLTHMYG